MKLRNLSDETLLDRTRQLVADERRLTAEILHHLREIDTRKLYAAKQLNYASLFEYATKEPDYYP